MATYTQVVPSGGEAQELLAKIQRTHLSYLQLEKTSEKLKSRWELESLITSHLSTVPHKEKFPCQRFLEILRRSVEDKTDFNSSKAGLAFNNINKYAENLICQPWRKEFKCLKLYSGFYKHQVESQLSCAEEIFNMMGYEEGEFMELNLDGPVDPDRVIDVSLNCLIAMVECKMMNDILEKLSESFNWQEVAAVRRHNTCGISKTAQLLSRPNAKRNRMYGYGEERAAATKSVPRYVKVEKLVDMDCGAVGADRKYPSSFYGSAWEEKPSHISTNGLISEDIFRHKAADEHLNLQNLLIAESRSNFRPLKYTPNPPFPPTEVGPRKDNWEYIERMQMQGPGQWSSVHNGRKVPINSYFDPGSPLNFNPNQAYVSNRSFSNSRPSAPTPDDIYRSVLTRKALPPKLCSSSSLPSSSDLGLGVELTGYDPNSYVYPNSRPNYMTGHFYQAKVYYPSPPVNSFEILPKMNNGGSSVLSLASEVENEGEAKRRSWYDNVDGGMLDAEFHQAPAVHSRPRQVINNQLDVLPPPTQFQNEPDPSRGSRTLPSGSSVSTSGNSVGGGHRRWPSDGSPMVRTERDSNKFISSASFDGKMNSGWSSKNDEATAKRSNGVANGMQPMDNNNGEMKSSGNTGVGWSCKACTFFNPSNSNICEICSRSRVPGAESDPLSSCGQECQKCTLINGRGASKCGACGSSLENSPTYV